TQRHVDRRGVALARRRARAAIYVRATLARRSHRQLVTDDSSSGARTRRWIPHLDGASGRGLVARAEAQPARAHSLPRAGADALHASPGRVHAYVSLAGLA